MAGTPKNDKLVVRNIGLMLSGDLDAPILDADALVAENGCCQRAAEVDVKADVVAGGIQIPVAGNVVPAGADDLVSLPDLGEPVTGHHHGRLVRHHHA